MTDSGDKTPLLDSKEEPWLPPADLVEVAGRYVILEQLGVGGMGRVYKALDKTLDRTVAVKVLASGKMNESMVPRFQREAKATSALDHEGIVNVFDFGITDDGYAYMIVEYLDGRCLDHFLEERGHLSVVQTIEIASEICLAMAHAHGRGIVHRDLKPSNLFVSHNEDGGISVRILDFGIARILDDTNPERTLTKAGQVVGSPYYLSPEQARGEKIDPRADIYSLGCIMFECLIGKPPFEGNSSVDVITRHIFEEPPLLGASGMSFPRDLENLVTKMLAKNADHRVQSMTDLFKDLNSLKQSLPPGKVEEDEDTDEIPDASARRIALLKILTAPVVLLIAAMGAMVYVVQNDSLGSLLARQDNSQGRSVVADEVIEKADERVKDPTSIDDFKMSETALSLDKSLIEVAQDGARFANFTNHDITRMSIEQVRESGVKIVHRERKPITPDELAMLCKLDLEKLHLPRVNLSNEDLALVNNLVDLRSLRLKGNYDITSAGLRQLTRLRNLRELNLQGCIKLDGEALDVITNNWRGLTYLDIGDTRISGADLPLLSRLKQLDNLDIGQLQLKDDDMRAISKLKLTTLNVARNEITAKGLEELARMKTLRNLGVKGCNYIDTDKFHEIKKSRRDVRFSRLM